MPAHQHKSNTKSQAGSSIAKSAAVAKLSAPERKAIRKAQAQSSKRVKNQHEFIMNSYINDAKIAHAKPKPTYEEKMVQKAKRDAWEARKSSTRMRKSVEIARDVLLEEEPILLGELCAEHEDEEGLCFDENYSYYFGSKATRMFLEVAKTYDPVKFRGSFSEFMIANFPKYANEDDDEDEDY
jgi:hypothetical protein